IDVNGNIAANNLPGIKFSGCSGVLHTNVCNNLSPGQSMNFDQITVNVPAPGFLFITASIELFTDTLGDGLAQFNVFKCDSDQCLGGVYLIRANADHTISPFGGTLITYSWVLQVDTAGPVTLRTNGTNDNPPPVSGSNDITATYHSLTAIYLAK